MTLMQHAQRELKIAGVDAKTADAVLTMVAAFVAEEPSGGSAPYQAHYISFDAPSKTVRDLFLKCAAYEPIMPLTGEDSEWVNVAEESGYPLWQNARCGRVFKVGDGQAYDIYGRVFREPNGCGYTNIDSRVPVTFPYTPTTVYVDRPAECEADHD